MAAPGPTPVLSPPLDPLALISAVDAFYSNAWNRLVFALTAFVTIVGIVFPFAIQYFQNRRFKSRLAKERQVFDAKMIEVEKRIEARMREDQAKIKAEVTGEFNNQLSKMKAELARQIGFARGMGYFLQAQSGIESGGPNLPLAIRSIGRSMSSVIAHNYDDNVNLLVSMLLEDALPHLNSSHFQGTAGPILQRDIDAILQSMRNHNKTGMRSRQIEAIETAVTVAKARLPPALPRR